MYVYFGFLSFSDLLWQEVDSKWVFVCVCPQLDLSQDLQEKFTYSDHHHEHVLSDLWLRSVPGW